jgi:hypothetical protein
MISWVEQVFLFHLLDSWEHLRGVTLLGKMKWVRSKLQDIEIEGWI